MPRPRIADESFQTSLRLPRELYEELAQVAGSKGIGTEIRERLKRSLAPDTEDERTRALLSQLARAVRLVEDAYGPSHKNALAAAVLRQVAANLIGPEPEKVEGQPARAGSELENVLRLFNDREGVESIVQTVTLLSMGIKF